MRARGPSFKLFFTRERGGPRCGRSFNFPVGAGAGAAYNHLSGEAVCFHTRGILQICESHFEN